MRSCEGLVDSLLYVIHTCVNTSDYDSKVSALLALSAVVADDNQLPTAAMCMPLALSRTLDPVLVRLPSRLKEESLNYKLTGT